MVYFFFITRPEGPIAHGHVGLHVFAIITDRSERAFGHFVSVGTEDHEIWPVTLNELVLRSNGIKNVSHAAGKAESVDELNFDLLRHYPIEPFARLARHATGDFSTIHSLPAAKERYERVLRLSSRHRNHFHRR